MIVYTAVYTAAYTAVVYMAGRPTGPCTRSQTVRYSHVRPVTAVYTARSQPIHGSVYGRVRRPLHGRPTRAYVYTAVKRPCTRHVQYTSVYTASTQSCTWQVGLHGRVHGPRRHVAAVGRVHGRNRHVHGRLHVPYTDVYMFVGSVHGPYAVTGRTRPYSVPSGNVCTAR